MARLARKISENGLYHIVFRGVNRQRIFEEEKDYQNDGLSARMRDYCSIRSVYLVDRDVVAALEKAGYKVAYGAVMAIASYNGETLNTTRGLAVAGDHASGYDTVNVRNPHTNKIQVKAA